MHHAPHHAPSPARTSVATLLTAALLACAGGPARSQTFLYALNTQGRVAVNGTEIVNLPGGTTIDYDDPDDIDTIWVGLAIDGPDWWALRYDGRLDRNGVQLDNLGDDDVWRDVLAHEGSLWTLREDGRIAIDGAAAVTFVENDYFFPRFVSDGSTVWTLRSDGRVHPDLEPATFRYDAADDDGDEIELVWTAMAVNPTDGSIWGLRRDGRIGAADVGALAVEARSDGTPPAVPTVEQLPFPDDSFDLGDMYQDIEFLADGTWVVLRLNGQVFTAANPDAALVNLPGDPDDIGEGSTYVDLATIGDEFFALRADGKVYANTDTTAIIDLPGSSYKEFALGTMAPDLSNVETTKPVVAKSTVKGITGEALVLGVLVSDIDTPDEDLVVTVEPDSIPPGATWDEKTRQITWDPMGPAGSYKIEVTADDGVNKPVSQTLVVKVSDPDSNETKNRKPVVAKVKKAQPLDGVAFSLPILAYDADGDELSITVDETEYPFTAGAVFDAMTNTFT